VVHGNGWLVRLFRWCMGDGWMVRKGDVVESTKLEDEEEK
jgi:hypothetical protein